MLNNYAFKTDFFHSLQIATNRLSQLLGILGSKTMLNATNRLKSALEWI